MPKRMLIDASHPEETRVVVLDGNRVEEFDFEAASKRPLKGNIYLAKVTRVEPSLQAAFVEYGGNRQGFLAFSEIHPDYYQIPVADRMAILEAQTRRMMAEEDFDAVDTGTAPTQEPLIVEAHSDELPPPMETFEVWTNDASDAHPEHGDDVAHSGDSRSGLADADAALMHEEAIDEDSSPVAVEKDAHEPGERAGLAQEPVSETVELQDKIYDSQSEDQSGFAEPVATGADANGAEMSTAEIAEPVTRDNSVQAESTGAPVAYERRGPRQNDRPRPPRRRQYKIQEVIKRRQIMLVQVVKEERGNKGASLTTFLSLAGRYCVLMPNTPRGGGISRKITSATDRKRLKSAAQSLELPEGMGLIIRTAGANRTKLEIKRDYEYLLRLWDTVRELTLKSNAPALVYEEGSLIKRVIRDLYSKDISEIVVDGDAGYRDAKDFMRMLMPSHAKNVKPYKEALPLFQSFHVESQLDAMFSPVVNLRSGGYIVINQTEALVSIDVNSGKATREHSIEETATKTNLEAADEIARQLRLRDLAGLIVIDFIDMEDSKNDRSVEKRLHNAVRNDRARIQIGKISQFGLLEMSRQRLRAGVLAGSTVTCPHCNGQGIIRSTESAALRLLRALDEEGQRQPAANVAVKAPPDVTIYTLNQKRREIARIEEAYELAISFEPQTNMMGGSFEIERTGVRIPSAKPKSVPVSVEAGFQEQEVLETDVTIVEAPVEPAAPVQAVVTAERDAGNGGNGNGEGRGRKRRRRRRGGRGRGAQQFQESSGVNSAPAIPPNAGDQHPESFTAENDEGDDEPEGVGEAAGDERQASSTAAPGPATEGADRNRRRRRRRGRRGRRRDSDPAHQGGEPAHEPAAVEGEQAAVPAVAFSSPPAEALEDQSVLAPNAPSSPLWSLSDHVAERPTLAEMQAQHLAATGALAPEPAKLFEPQPAQAIEPEPASAMADAINPILERSPVPVLDLPEETVPEDAAPTNEPPREARKGWWQRRFKV